MRKDFADVNCFGKHDFSAFTGTSRLLPEAVLSLRNVHVNWSKEDCFGFELSQVCCVVHAHTGSVDHVTQLVRVVPVDLQLLNEYDNQIVLRVVKNGNITSNTKVLKPFKPIGTPKSSSKQSGPTPTPKKKNKKTSCYFNSIDIFLYLVLFMVSVFNCRLNHPKCR